MAQNFFATKKTFFIVLWALVNAQYNFMDMDVESYGKNCRGGILSHSKIGKGFDQNKLNVPEKEALLGTTNEVPYVVIGDVEIPLKTFLL